MADGTEELRRRAGRLTTELSRQSKELAALEQEMRKAGAVANKAQVEATRLSRLVLQKREIVDGIKNQISSVASEIWQINQDKKTAR